MKLCVLSKAEYKTFVEEHPQASFLQTLEHADFKEKMGNTVHLVGLKENDKVLAATLLIETKTIFNKRSFYAPRGFLIDYHNKDLLKTFTEELKKYIKSNNGFRVIIDPNVDYQVRESSGDIIKENIKDDETINNLKDLGYKHFGFNNFLETIQIRFAYRLILDEEYELVKMRFSKSTRKNIESCYKKGLSVRKGKVEDLPAMEELFASTATRKNFLLRSLEYYEKMYASMKDLMTIYIAYLDPDKYLEATLELLKKEQTKLEEINNKINKDHVGTKLLTQKETAERLVKKYEEELEKAKKFKEENPNGKDIGCLLSMRSGNEYLTLTSGGLEEYHSFTPKYAMYDAHIKDAYLEGFKACNFYGISGNFQKENNPLYGVYEFKRGFGGNVIEYIGQFTLPVTKFNTIYNLLSKIRSIVKH